MTIADSTDRRIVVGAAWMIAARVADRTIGFISVGILARVLVPADFGLIAMAVIVVAAIAQDVPPDQGRDGEIEDLQIEIIE